MSIFDRIAKRASRANMKIFSQLVTIYPAGIADPAGAFTVPAEFGSDYTSDGFTEELQVVVSILRSDWPRYKRNALIVAESGARWVVEGLNDRSQGGKYTTAEEWVLRVRRVHDGNQS